MATTRRKMAVLAALGTLRGLCVLSVALAFAGAVLFSGTPAALADCSGPSGPLSATGKQTASSVMKLPILAFKTGKTIDSVQYGRVMDLLALPGGDLIVAGESGFIAPGNSDGWVARLGPNLDVRWQRTIGGEKMERLFAVDGDTATGFVAVGLTESSARGEADALVLKYDRSGRLLWKKTFGKDGLDIAKDVANSPAGGYVVVGNSIPEGSNKSEAWFMKLDFQGDQQAVITLKRENSIAVYDLLPVSDGYVVAGSTKGKDWKERAAWAAKLDRNGDITWEKTYPNMYDEKFSDSYSTPDGSIVMVGNAARPNGKVGFFVRKIRSNGDSLWVRRYFMGDNGGMADGDVSGAAIVGLDEGKIMVSGELSSVEGRQSNLWLAGLSPDGAILWEKTMPINAESRAAAISRLSDGSFAVGGEFINKCRGKERALLFRVDAAGSAIP